MGFFDKLKKAFSFEPENEENEAEKVADKAEAETSDANYADSAEEASKSELVEKKLNQSLIRQVKNPMKQMAKMIRNSQLQKMFWKKKLKKSAMTRDLPNLARDLAQKSMRFLQISGTLMKISLMIWKKR